MTIAKTGSIAKASEQLLLGQPAISAQLKQLEENLGTQLFDRKNRRLVLNDAGKVALEYAEKIFQNGEELLQVFHNKSYHKKERLRLGALDIVPKHFLSQIVEFIDKTGKNQVTITEKGEDELRKGLEKHELDLVISNKPIRSLNGQKVRTKNIFSDKVGIYGHKKYQKLKRGFPESISGKPFILPTDHSSYRYDIEHYFTEHGLEYDLVAETQDNALKKILCEHGRGLIFLSEKVARIYTKKEMFYKIGRAEGIVEEYWLTYTERLIQSNLVKEIVKNFTIET